MTLRSIMVCERHGWTNPNVEGKILRKLVKRLNKLIEKPLVLTIRHTDEDGELMSEPEQITRSIGNHIDHVVKIAHCISQVAQAKNSMAKTGEMQKDIDKIKDHLGIK